MPPPPSINCRNVHSILGELKSQALGMSSELDEQNEILDRLGRKTDSNINRVVAASDRTVGLMRK